jgi:hypothetical protein
VAEAAGGSFVFEGHDTMEVKGLGPVPTCLLVGRSSAETPPLAAEKV